jgi:hypothetical protein
MDELNQLATKYKDICDKFSAIEAEKKAYNSMIKNLMNENGITKHVSPSGISLSVSKQRRTSYDEEGLLKFAHTVDVDGLIQTKEYVDMDVLENALYHRQISSDDIKPFIKVNVIEALKCSQKELLNE